MSNQASNLSAEAQAFLSMNKSPVATGQVRENPTPFSTLTISQENGIQTGPEGDSVAVAFGEFFIPGLKLHSPEITFRPIKYYYKMLRRTTDFKVVGETVYFANWNEGKEDTLGGDALGRVFGKDAKELSGAAAEANRLKGDVYMDVFGLAYFPGEDTPVFVRFRNKGGKMARIGEAFESAGTSSYNEYKYTIKTVLPTEDKTVVKGRKPGYKPKNNHVNILISVEPGAHSIMDIAEQGGELIKYIDEHNAAIIKRHKQAAKNVASEEAEEFADEIEELE